MTAGELRRQLAVLARSRHSRVVGLPSRGLPSDWRPHTVANPESSQVVLDHPKGARGFVLLVDLEGSSQTLYVKIQLGVRSVIGRSFHYSYEPGLHGTPRVRRDD